MFLGMPEITLPQATIQYRESGSGEPVVFLHGVLVNGTLWRKVTPHLDGLRCIVPDLPLGAHAIPANPGMDFSPPGLARLVADFLEALDLRDVTLVGNDTGGAITQLVAARHPERLARIVLTSCDAFDNFLPKMFKPLQLGARMPAVLLALVQPLRLRSARRLPIAFGWLTKRPVDPREVEDAWVRRFFADGAIRRDTFAVLRGIDKRHTLAAAEELRNFDKPALLAWATEDKVFPFAHAERLAEILPDARVVGIDDSYSFVPEDQPEALARAIAAFVRETAPARA